MSLLWNNIGNIVLGICGLIVLCSTGGGTPKTKRQIAEEEDEWYYNPVNPCGPNWRGL